MLPHLWAMSIIFETCDLLWHVAAPLCHACCLNIPHMRLEHVGHARGHAGEDLTKCEYVPIPGASCGKTTNCASPHYNATIHMQVKASGLLYTPTMSLIQFTFCSVSLCGTTFLKCLLKCMQSIPIYFTANALLYVSFSALGKSSIQSSKHSFP